MLKLKDFKLTEHYTQILTHIKNGVRPSDIKKNCPYVVYDFNIMQFLSQGQCKNRTANASMNRLFNNDYINAHALYKAPVVKFFKACGTPEQLADLITRQDEIVGLKKPIYVKIRGQVCRPWGVMLDLYLAKHNIPTLNKIDYKHNKIHLINRVAYWAGLWDGEVRDPQCKLFTAGVNRDQLTGTDQQRFAYYSPFIRMMGMYFQKPNYKDSFYKYSTLKDEPKAKEKIIVKTRKRASPDPQMSIIRAKQTVKRYESNPGDFPVHELHTFYRAKQILASFR